MWAAEEIVEKHILPRKARFVGGDAALDAGTTPGHSGSQSVSFNPFTTPEEEQAALIALQEREERIAASRTAWADKLAACSLESENTTSFSGADSLSLPLGRTRIARQRTVETMASPGLKFRIGLLRLRLV